MFSLLDRFHASSRRSPATRKPARTRLAVTSLEERLVPSWGATPPASLTVPSSNVVQVALNTSGDATGTARIATTETDWYRFTAATGGSYTFDATTPTSSLDTVAAVYSATGRRLGFNDDVSSSNTDSRVTVTLAAGQTYLFGVTNYTGTSGGAYTWKIDGPAAVVVPNPTPTADAWTIFVYMTASDLQEFAHADINEMEQAVSQLPSSVNVVVLWDQSSTLTAYSTGNGAQAAWGTTGRAVIAADTNRSQVATTFEIVGEKNTGNPTTLRDFLVWGAGVAPASNYSLVMWNHGAGLYGSNYDDADGGTTDFLSVSETAGVLGSAGVPAISVLCYDACLMGMAEVGHAFKDKVQFFTASEELVAGDGHDYTTLFDVLKTSPAAVTAEQLARAYVASFGNQYLGTGVNEDTNSATRATAYNSFAAALKAFTDATATASSTTRGYLRTARNAATTYDGDAYKDFRDLGSFMAKVAADARIPAGIRTAANGVLTSLNSLVVSKTADRRNSSGVAIYLPGNAYDSTYTSSFSAFTAATGWDKFAKWLATGTRTTTATTTATRGPASRVTDDARAVSRALLGYETDVKLDGNSLFGDDQPRPGGHRRPGAGRRG